MARAPYTDAKPAMNRTRGGPLDPAMHEKNAKCTRAFRTHGTRPNAALPTAHRIPETAHQRLKWLMRSEADLPGPATSVTNLAVPTGNLSVCAQEDAIFRPVMRPAGSCRDWVSGMIGDGRITTLFATSCRDRRPPGGQSSLSGHLSGHHVRIEVNRSSIIRLATARSTIGGAGQTTVTVRNCRSCEAYGLYR